MTRKKVATENTGSGEWEDENRLQIDEQEVPSGGENEMVSEPKEPVNKIVSDQDTSEEKIKELEEKYLRLSAEFDNYRKRTLREKMDLTKTAGEELLVNLLPVMDDLERGLHTIAQATDIDGIKAGMDLIYAKFQEFLAQRGVKEIEARGKEFNTDLHEAITKIPAPEDTLKGKVVDVVQKGYFLYDKVIRFPKVVIGE